VNKLKKYAIVAALTISCLTLSACDQQQYEDDRGVGDAPPISANGAKGQDNSSKIVTGMPDQFPNVATSCVANGFRAFVTTRMDDSFIVLVDPSCRGFVK